MDITTYITQKKKSVASFLHSHEQSRVLPMLSPVNSWGTDAVMRLLEFSLRGKMFRAVLVFLGHDVFTPDNKNEKDLIAIAAALELTQAGLLIHDDVMDQDEMRRGTPSVYAALTNDVIKTALDPKRTGESLAVCIGDLGYYLAFDLLSRLSIPNASDILSTYSREIAKVAVAQMQDVSSGSAKEKLLTRQDIVSLYQYKTGRYTIALPLVLGALTANVPEKAIEKLWEFGETLGIGYQLQDDMLNIFGDPAQTGKPVGSDIRENKQTLLRLLLFEKAAADDLKKLRTIFGNATMRKQDVFFVQTKMKEYGVDKTIEKELQICRSRAGELLSQIQGSTQLLSQFVDHITHRVQ